MKVYQLIGMLQEFPPDHEVRFFDLFERPDGGQTMWDTSIEDVSLYPNEQVPFIMLKGRTIVRQELKEQIDKVTSNMDCFNLRQFLKDLFARRMK